MLFAHIKNGEQNQVKQTLAVHVRNTAKYAAENLKTCGLYHAGYTAGLLHDLGKAKQDFQQYIQDAADGKQVVRGSVNHSYASLIWLWKHYHGEKNTIEEQCACEVLAYCVGAHHGLFNPISEDGEDGFEYRLNKLCSTGEFLKESIGYEESVPHFFSECVEEKEVEKHFFMATSEVQSFIEKIKDDKRFPTSAKGKTSERKFAVGMLCRLVLSGLIDADFHDTADFMQGVCTNGCLHIEQNFWEKQLKYMENKLHGMPQDKINVARNDISNQCRAFAEKKGGIYRLSVPTGSGKTLATLRYALAHAMEYQKQQIFFVIPLLSVIDQNAKVIRDNIEDKEAILEHHSNVIRTTDDVEDMDKYQTLTQNWKNPIIITTLVQMLNTLFSGKLSCVRRFHSLCN